MVWLLIAAAVVSGALGEWIDTLAILAIVLLNGVLGFLQEDKVAAGTGCAGETGRALGPRGA